MIECIPYGDRALLINFEQELSLEINRKVLTFKDYLSSTQGVLSLIPAYCSLTVGYDPKVTSFEQLKQLILNKPNTQSTSVKSRRICIPVCYENEFAPDIDAVRKQTGLDTSQIIDLHTNTLFHIYMMGFIPGFAYMGKLPKALVCERKKTPRKKVPAGSVGLAGFQTGIYPSVASGGWQLIGQTPVHIFRTNSEHPFLFKHGDEVRFKPISADEYMTIEKEEMIVHLT